MASDGRSDVLMSHMNNNRPPLVTDPNIAHFVCLFVCLFVCVFSRLAWGARELEEARASARARSACEVRVNWRVGGKRRAKKPRNPPPIDQSRPQSPRVLVALYVTPAHA